MRASLNFAGELPATTSLSLTSSSRSTVSGSITCLKGFMKKCGTPIQRELFDFMMEQFVESVNLFCNTPETRQGEFDHR